VSFGEGEKEKKQTSSTPRRGKGEAPLFFISSREKRALSLIAKKRLAAAEGKEGKGRRRQFRPPWEGKVITERQEEGREEGQHPPSLQGGGTNGLYSA